MDWCYRWNIGHGYDLLASKLDAAIAVIFVLVILCVIVGILCYSGGVEEGKNQAKAHMDLETEDLNRQIANLSAKLQYEMRREQIRMLEDYRR